MKLQLMKCPLCNETLLPTKHNNGLYVHEYQTACAFVCDELSEIQIEVLHDAALGRAVRRFSEGMALFKQNPEWAFRQGYSGDIIRRDTPEAALQAAGLMEGEEK